MSVGLTAIESELTDLASVADQYTAALIA